MGRTSAIHDNYVEILKCLRQIVDDQVEHGLDGDDVAKATGILACIAKPEFVYMMIFLKDLFEILKPAEKILRARDVGFVKAVPVITAVIREVKQLQMEEKFAELVEKAQTVISEANIQLRNRTRLSVENNETAQARIEKQYFAALDLVLAELNRRFKENDDILHALSNAQNMDLDLNTLKPLTALHRIEMPSESEITVAKSYLETKLAKNEEKKSDEDDNKRKTVLQCLYTVREAFPAVFKFFSAIETFPSANARFLVLRESEYSGVFI